MEKVDCLVIGAGVIGLAVARELAAEGREVIVLEAANKIGSGISSRNSEVIHAGIYYTSGLAKAELCVTGKNMLYRFCAEFGVPHRRCGKLIIASTKDEVEKLSGLKAQAEKNGVHDLAWLSSADVKALEPELTAVAGLISPSTGILDSQAYMLALLGAAEQNGAVLALNTTVVGGDVSEDGILIKTAGPDVMNLKAAVVVNAAGLGAQKIAKSIVGMDPSKVPPLYLAKGNYFSLTVKTPFHRLVYPIPAEGGLGIHFTLDVGGGGRFGPDVEWIEELDYSVDPERSLVFYEAIRKYWPALPENSLAPAYAGIRPKVEQPGGSRTDFVIQGAREHGVAGLVNLFGIESPGLTSSLAIAQHVARLVS